MTTDPLDRYRRAAKALKSAHRAGSQEARMRLAAHPPRRGGTVLKHADYLHVIAQENGFASWPAMKAAVETLGLDRAARVQRLKIALFHGQTHVVESLLAETPDLADGHLGLQIALYDRDAVAAALAADPEAATRACGPRTPLLHLCASRMIHVWPARADDMLAIADLLRDHGADVNESVPAEPDSNNRLSALYFALGHANNLPLARWLLQHGANPNDNESLYHATELGHREGVRMLLEHGADPGGTNALLRAMDFHDTAMVRMLLEAGADPNEFFEADTGGGGPLVLPALHQAARRMSGADMIGLLMEHGADPARLWQGASAYAFACVYGNNALRDRIGALGMAPPLTREEELMARAARGQDSAGEFIDPENLSVEFRNILRNLVTMPDRLGHVQRLVALGLEYDRPDPVEAITPVQFAGWEGLPEMMGYLLGLRPDLSHVNGYGGTLLSTIIHGSENAPSRTHRDHVGCARIALEHGVALPRRAIALAADPAMAQFLADWAAAHPGQVVQEGVA